MEMGGEAGIWVECVSQSKIQSKYAHKDLHRKAYQSLFLIFKLLVYNIC